MSKVFDVIEYRILEWVALVAVKPVDKNFLSQICTGPAPLH